VVYTTTGEDLFFLVKNHVLPSLGPSRSAWVALRDVFDNVSGSTGFDAFVRGAVAVHAVRRLIRLWQHETEQPVAEHLRVRRAAALATTEVFPGLDQGLATRLARLVIAAVNACHRPVSSGIRKGLLAISSIHSCYLCGFALDAKADDADNAFLTLEHLWPTSLGGDSVEDNLLPACRRCQEAKGDAVSWEWLNVHNLVLPPGASDAALKAVPWSVRIARHYMHVIGACERDKMHLKQAFLCIGPIAGLAYRGGAAPVTFFDLQTV
jgi:HNH endonuclease